MRTVYLTIAALLFIGSEFASAAVAKQAAALSSSLPSNEEFKQALDSLKLRDPVKAKQIMALREKDPAAFSKAILRVANEEGRLAKLRRSIPENIEPQIAMWKNREKLGLLMREFGDEQDPAGRQIIESQIDNLLGEQFELRRQMKSNRLKRAEKKLAEMRLEVRTDALRARDRFIAEWKPKLLAKRPTKTE
jgi:hypothetical protein